MAVEGFCDVAWLIELIVILTALGFNIATAAIARLREFLGVSKSWINSALLLIALLALLACGTPFT